MRDALLITCEHASRFVPARYQPLFASRHARQALVSHRGLDIGALETARRIERAFGCPLVLGSVTRLLIDLNRSPWHPRLFSEYSRDLDPSTKTRLSTDYYVPYRARVKTLLEGMLRRSGRVVHVSVHSFTPSLDGQVRHADVGLLYDPRRARERELGKRWRALFNEADARLRVRCNYPYRGVNDGFTRTLRQAFPPRRYLGFELELNQQFFLGKAKRERTRLTKVVLETLSVLLNSPG